MASSLIERVMDSSYYVYIKPIFRLGLIILFLLSTFSVSMSLNWTSILSLICFGASYLLLPKTKPKPKKPVEEEWNLYEGVDLTYNPYKGKTSQGTISEEKEKELCTALQDYCMYDAANTKSVQKFKPMMNRSDCVFAKKARIWGSPDFQENISIEENIKRLYPTFLKFICSFEDVCMDGFIIELPGHLFGTNIEIFSDAVRRTLLTLKSCDNIRKGRKMKRLSTPPSSSDSSLLDDKIPDDAFCRENTSSWEHKKWVFEICQATFFVTSFAPFYSETNSRYNFGLPDCYLLFQPEISFAIHDLPPDTPVTNWRKPVTVRDRIRKAFYESGREYTAPMVNGLPMVYEIVTSLEPNEEPIKWWMDTSGVKNGHEKKE